MYLPPTTPEIQGLSIIEVSGPASGTRPSEGLNTDWANSNRERCGPRSQGEASRRDATGKACGRMPQLRGVGHPYARRETVRSRGGRSIDILVERGGAARGGGWTGLVECDWVCRSRWLLCDRNVAAPGEGETMGGTTDASQRRRYAGGDRLWPPSGPLLQMPTPLRGRGSAGRLETTATGAGTILVM